MGRQENNIVAAGVFKGTARPFLFSASVRVTYSPFGGLKRSPFG
jgi:hypothetical protein